jgi:uncharacterized protein YndB with AHSA1/START domain
MRMAKANYELSVERYIDASPAAVFKVWAVRLAEWSCPKPWTTELAELDLRPGRRFALVMRSPAGARHAQEGVVLEVIPGRSGVFTDAFTTGWIPQAPSWWAFSSSPPKRAARVTAPARGR